MYALIDCDNFFVSCERVFQPKLKNCPVVVLSNNDGCVVARSYEAKAIGIPMCSPFFKVEHLLKAHQGLALSSNYELYANISQRVMSIIHQTFANIEIYSIDEAFVYLPPNNDYYQMALNIRNQILKEVGISVSIGIAATKTLCKIAGDYAKKHDKIYFFDTKDKISSILQSLEIINIWGVGRSTAQKLNYMGIFTAQDLQKAPLKMIRQALGITIEKTILELNQTPCLEVNTEEPQQSIISSRSFEYEIRDFEQLKTIIAEFVDNACLRLRHQRSIAKGLITYVSSNRFNLHHEQYQNSALVNLETPSNNTAKFMEAMQKGLKQIYRSDIFYKRAGVTLVNIEDINVPQPDFWINTQISQKEQNLMQAFDNINAKMGRKSIYFGTQAAGVKHYIRREFKSSSYTTSWNGLASVI